MVVRKSLGDLLVVRAEICLLDKINMTVFRSSAVIGSEILGLAKQKKLGKPLPGPSGVDRDIYNRESVPQQ